MRRCPRCGRQMSAVGVGAVRLDGCDGCGGVWFDGGELQAVAHSHSADLVAIEEHWQPDEHTTRRREAAICPVCERVMVPFALHLAPDVTLDRCPECRGIWADEGELDALYRAGTAAHPAGSTPPAAASRQRQSHEVAGFMMRAKCPSCGELVPATDAVCWACGQVLKRVWDWLCPACDQQLACGGGDDWDLGTCGDCGGVWLPYLTMHQLGHCPPETWQLLAQRLHTTPPTAKPRDLRCCPACRLRLDRHPYCYGSSVRIDRCTACRGVWLDHGELDRVSHYLLVEQRFFEL